MYQYRNLHLLEISFKNKSEKDFFFFFPRVFWSFIFYLFFLILFYF